jgi:predicted amidohydrolase
MRISIVQNIPKLASDNFQPTIEIIKKCSSSDIVMFPELSLHGYMLMDAVYDEALTKNDFSIFQNASNELDIDILLGTIIKEDNNIYNSSIYISNGDIINIHHKNNLPNYGMFEEKRFFDSGNTIKIFETSFGKSLMLICEDIWSKDIFDLVLKSDITNMFILANSPTREFKQNGDLEIENRWEKIFKSITNKLDLNIFFANRVGFEDGIGFWGGSRAILKNGKTQKLKLFEENILNVDIEV